MTATVLSVSRCGARASSKEAQDGLRLIEGLGVEGDAHPGAAVLHRPRAAQDPAALNLDQVHLIQAELQDALRAAGFRVWPGAMDENVTTTGLDLLGLPQGSRLRLGAEAVVAVTGLRNPCIQLDRFQPGLMAAVLGRDAEGKLVRKAGVMAVVVAGGEVRAGDLIEVELPPRPHRRLGRV